MQMILLCALSAVLFVIWPNLTKSTGLTSSWTIILVSITSVFPSFAYLWWKGDPTPDSRQITVGIIAGLINGLGFIIYSTLLNRYEVSRVITIIDIMASISAVLLGILVYGETMSLNKGLGIFLGCLSIYFLHRT